MANLLAAISKSRTLTPEVEAAIDNLFTYKKWNDEEAKAGTEVRNSLANAMKTVVKNVPPGQIRDMVIVKLLGCRMDCNMAITFAGQC
jgi:hypothetical protein